MKGVNNNNQQNQISADEKKVEGIVNADLRIREGVKDLAEALFELNDKEVAQKIIAEHIMMLNELFKTFE